MQLSAARIMSGLRGGDVVMENLETAHGVRRARDSVTSGGATRSRPRLNLSGGIGFFTAKKRRTRSVRGAAVLGKASGGERRGCGQCPHLGLRIRSYIGRTGPDSARFRRSPVFARAGIRFESHLGHMFPLVRGPFALGLWTTGPILRSGCRFWWLGWGFPGLGAAFLSRSSGWAFLLLHGGEAG